MADSSSDTKSQQIRPLPITIPPGSIKSTPRGPDALMGELIAERYKVLDILGVGGMGAVYAVEDVVSGGSYALKLLRRTALSRENRRRFRREISAAARVRHPHLVQVIAHGTHNHSPFLVMEQLHGETLQARIQREGALPVVDCVVIMLQLLDALSAVHAANFLHRDVKPSNVFLCDRGGAKDVHDVRLIDFGLARVLRPEPTLFSSSLDGGEENTGLTATGVIPGTPAYLAPEQVVGARDLDQRVDVWAAGLVLYEMLCGHRVFANRVFEELVKDIVYAEVPPASARAKSWLPENFDALLRQAMARSRDDRFATAQAFRTALVAVWSRYRALGLQGEKG